MAKILAVDDEQVFRKIIRSVLGKRGYDVVTAGSAQEALDQLDDDSFDLIISDIRMKPISGIDLLQQVRKTHPELNVIMLTACEQVDVALHAMKLGAFDYLTKPLQVSNLVLTVQHALEYAHSTSSRVAQVRLDYHKEQEKLDSMVAQSIPMIHVCDMIERVAPTHEPVLICGEPGSGSELAARNIYRCSSRRELPFVKIDCATIPSETLEAHLFGENDDAPQTLINMPPRGTLFIHRVEDLSLRAQDRLEQALKLEDGPEHTPALRLISSSAKDLQQLVLQGRFRTDLHQRIRTFTINIPPLRDRTEDIHPLMARIIAQHIGPDAEMPMLSWAAEQLLVHYLWPGNVRELINTVQYALAHLQNNMITRESLPLQLVEEASMTCDLLKVLKQPESLKGRSLKSFLHDENGPIKKALKQYGSQNRATGHLPPHPPSSPGDTSPFEWL